jgi:hypothetical protein
MGTSRSRSIHQLQLHMLSFNLLFKTLRSQVKTLGSQDTAADKIADRGVTLKFEQSSRPTRMVVLKSPLCNRIKV